LSRIRDMVHDVILNHFGNQGVDGAPAGGQAVHCLRTVGFFFDGSFNGVQLAFDAADTVEQFILLGDDVAHGLNEYYNLRRGGSPGRDHAG
jgi:hypothetical protein